MPRKKVSKDQQIAELVSSIAPIPERSKSKIEVVIERLGQPDGVTISDLCEATGWQAHSVRGAMSGTLKRARKLTVESLVVDGVRRYRIANAAR